jgi:hypothetical protein
MKRDAESDVSPAPQGTDEGSPDHSTAILPGTPPAGQETAYRAAPSSLKRAAKSLAEKTVIKDRFELESMLGSGGMGTVYKARDLRKVEARDRDPWVAIKLLNEDFKEHPDALISLQREARKSQALTHPHIVKVFDFDRDGDTVFLTMELLRGQDLNQFIAAHPTGIGVPEVQRLAGEIGDALRHAHQSGIVHADFTPKNVFLTREGTAKVLDFGIAHAIADADSSISAGDQTVFDPASLGALTPSYASLERLNGEDPSPADDIYGLGCIIYELLSGDHPTDYATARDAVAQRIQPRRIRALSSKQWRSLQRAMAVSAQDRYADVGQFLTDFLPRRGGVARPLAIAAVFVLMVSSVAAWQIYDTRLEQRTAKAQIAAEQRALADSRDVLQQEQTATTRQVSEDLERVSQELLNLAATLIDNRQFEEAGQFLDRVRKSTPDHPRLDELQSSLEASRKDHQQQRLDQVAARAEVGQLLNEIELKIAGNELMHPDDDSAYSRYLRILALEPRNIDAQAVLQRLVQLQLEAIDGAMDSGELQEASRKIADLAILSPGNRNLNRLRARLNRQLEQRQQREEQIANLLQQAQRLVDAGSANQRMDVYRQVLAIDPQHPRALEGMAETRAELAKADAASQQKASADAQALLRNARRLLAQTPIAADNYQQGYAQLLDAQELQPQSQEIIALLDELPRLYLTAIRKTIASGNYNEADKLAQAAAILTPGDERLGELQAELLELASEEAQPVLPPSF